MKINVLLSILLFSCFANSGCKKYPEDDRRYLFKSPMKRLSYRGKVWEVYKYYVNGSDSTISLYQKYSSLYSGGWKVTIETKESHKKDMKFTTLIGDGEMKLIDHKNKINIIMNTKGGMYNPFVVPNSDWAIKELTVNDFIIEAFLNGSNYRIELKY